MSILKILPDAVDSTANYVFGTITANTITANGTNLYTYISSAYNQANSANVLAQAAFDKANTGGAGADQYARDTANSASSNTIIIQGVDTTQNTRMSIIEGVDSGQNTRMSIIEGVNTTQNTNITTANVKAQAAFDKANTTAAGAVSNVSLTYSNTASGTIPTVNSLKPGEPSLNLNDGRMFIQLNNGKIVDISTTPTGNTYHVAMNGDDSFIGDTPSAAKRTIRAAVAAAQPGDSVIVHTGKYIEDTPIIIPQNVQVQGAGERTCIIEPQTSVNDIFWVNNNSYVTGFKFVNYTGSAVAFPAATIESDIAQEGSSNTITLAAGASPYDNYYNSMRITITSGLGSGQTANVILYDGTTKVATVDANWSTQPDISSNYSLKIPLRTTPASLTSRYTTYITGSPYIYNSSSITTTGTGIKIDGDLATGNKSIISAQFTQVNSGGKGIHILNDGYSQLVSIYAIFCDTGFLAESGGTASMGNCNVNFGNKGLVANGKGKLAMTATLANTSQQAVNSITLNNVTANTQLSVTANVPYTGLIMKLSENAEEYWLVTEATPLSGGNTVVTFQTTIFDSISSGNTVYFYQQSQLRASGQTFEFVGAGTNINAIPRLGGVANTLAQTIVINEGAVFATSTDQSGNFTVSDLTINQSTSTITGRTFSKSLFAEMTPYILALEG
jgi:hypothetical protein